MKDVRRGGVQIDRFFIEGVFTTQNETIELKPDTQTTISLSRCVPKIVFTSFKGAFD